MCEFNCYTKEFLLSFKPKYYHLISSFMVVLIILIIISSFININDIYTSKAYVECDNECILTMSVEPTIFGKLNNISYLYLNKIRIDKYELTYNDIETDINTNTSYQLVTIKIDKIDINNKTLQDIKIYYNEEKLIKKIINVFLEN